MSRRLLFLIFAAIFLLTLSFSSAFDRPDTTAPSAPEQKFVTLQSDKRTLSQALTDLTKQTGIHLEALRDLPDQTLHLDLKHVPFWQAVDAVAAAAKARVNLYPTSGRIALAKRGSNYR